MSPTLRTSSVIWMIRDAKSSRYLQDIALNIRAFNAKFELALRQPSPSRILALLSFQLSIPRADPRGILRAILFALNFPNFRQIPINISSEFKQNQSHNGISYICVDNANIFNSENFCIIEQYVRLNFELYIVIVYTTSKLNFILNLYFIYVLCVILKREREKER